MAHIIEDRIKETSTTTGTGAITLAGAPTGYKTFSSVMATGDTTYYAIVNSTAGEWEVGLGYLSGATTLERRTVYNSSNSNTLVSLTAGSKDVFMTLAADRTATIASGNQLILPIVTGVSIPPIPASGTFSLFVRNRAGKSLLNGMGAAGIDFAVQPHLAYDGCALASPVGNSTTIGGFGFSNTNIGTAAAANVATTNVLTSMKRIQYNSATSSGSSAGWVNNTLQYFRSGSNIPYGGFYFTSRFGFKTITATRRWFVGMQTGTAGLANANPSNQANIIGIGQDSGDTNIQFMHNSNVTTATKFNSGFVSPTTADAWEFRVFSKPGDTLVYMSIEQLGTEIPTLVEYTASANLPAPNTLMTPCVWANNTNTASAIQVCLVRAYLATDF